MSDWNAAEVFVSKNVAWTDVYIRLIRTIPLSTPLYALGNTSIESQVMKDCVPCKEVQKADYRSKLKSIEWTAACTRALSKLYTLFNEQ